MAETGKTEVVVSNPNVMQALLKVDFELLGTKLVAEYYKGTDADYYLLMPTDEADTRGITVSEMINDISTLLGVATESINIEELTKSINSIGLNIDDIKVTLKMAYFYMITDGKDTKNNKTEYAFQLEIDTSAVLPDSMKLFDINRVGVAVWNTERAKIISQMNLYKPEDLLKM